MRNNAQDPQDLAGDEALVFPNNLPQVFYDSSGVGTDSGLLLLEFPDGLSESQAICGLDDKASIDTIPLWGDTSADLDDLDYDIVPSNSDESIMTFRMDSNETAVRMPEIGRSVIHTEGVQLIADWINAMEPNDCSDF